jgi:predicted nucleotidyltransferase
VKPPYNPDMEPAVPIDATKIAEICRRYRIRKLSLFGSVIRPDFGPASDVDVLVEFEEGATPGLRFFTLERELSQVFGRRVDLNTAAFLSPRIRNDIVSGARDVYVAA